MKNVITMLAIVVGVTFANAQVRVTKKQKAIVTKPIDVKKADAQRKIEAQKIENDFTSEYKTIYDFNSVAACPDDLADDGCTFISGTGRDMSIDYKIINILNSCRIPDLPSYYVWDGNQTQTRIITIDYNNCCYSYESMNGKINRIVGSAMGSRPHHYLVRNYRRVSGQRVTVYGPYRVTIEVTYRKVKSKLTAFNQYQVKTD